MTDTPTPADTTEDLDEVLEKPPFLRFTGTYPAGEGWTTVQVEMHLGDSEELGTYEEDDATAVKSWITDLCVAVIDALRSNPPHVTAAVDDLNQRTGSVHACSGGER